jgi:hypothetical protein
VLVSSRLLQPPAGVLMADVVGVCADYKKLSPSCEVACFAAAEAFLNIL